MLLFTGYHLPPKTAVFRILCLSSYIYIILYSAYTATLISFLNVQKLHLPFTGFRSLLEYGSFKLTAPRGSARISYFQVRIITMIFPKSSLLFPTICHQLKKTCWRTVDLITRLPYTGWIMVNQVDYTVVLNKLLGS